MECIYDILFQIYYNDKDAEYIVGMARRIERRIIWAISELLTSLAIMHIFKKIGTKVQNERSNERGISDIGSVLRNESQSNVLSSRYTKHYSTNSKETKKEVASEI
jgi:hypothetical protein